ncbi:MAG TPA: ATP-dependent 6-phosphofructokinase [Longimicrobiales bacterium]
MANAKLRIAINTGGGDAPGLNAVIRAAVLAALRRGWEVYGIRRGYAGLLGDDLIVPMDKTAVRGIAHLGGTILGTTNRGNPFEIPVKDSAGNITYVDRSDEIIANFQKHRLDALIAIGGDGSLRIANQLFLKGMPIVAVPKTIDNDLAVTEVTFGFNTAVQTASDAIDKLHSTAESHERVMVVEVMGRSAGWIALESGISGTADVILLPEIPYDIGKVCEKVRERYDTGRRFAIIVVAEGAYPAGGEPFFVEKKVPGQADRYGGIAERVAQEIAEHTGYETRSMVLGHLQRGGTPTAFDRLIASRLGAAAVRTIANEDFGTMVALATPDIKAVPIPYAIAKIKKVPLDSDVMNTARELGISFGD